MPILQSVKNWISSGLALFIGAGVVFGPTVYCLDKVMNGQGNEIFRLGSVPVPKFLGAGATYWTVLVLDIFALVVIFVGIYLDHKEYKLEKDFRTKYGQEEPYLYSDYLIRSAREKRR